MKRKLDLGAVIVLMLLVATVTWLVAQWQTTEVYNKQIEKTLRTAEEFKKVKQAKEYIESAFIGSWDEEKLLDGATRGMLESLGDQWSVYLNAEDFQELKASGENKYVGIGIEPTLDEETGGVRVTYVNNDTPAQEAGLMISDIIIGIDGEEVADMEYPMAIEKIRGEVNTIVKLEILRPSTNRTFTAELVRKELVAESIRARVLEGNIGYIRIRNFDTGTDVAFINAVTELQIAGVKGIIFDVRNNLGGRLDVMSPMLNTLLPECVLFQSRDKSGKADIRESDANSVELPMMVLINENSYSAAEYFAAVLKEYEYAELVGQPTTGKGYAQVQIELIDGSGLVLSTAEYFTPKGVSLAETGLAPDYSVALTSEQTARFYSLEPNEDPQIIKAYEVLTAKVTAAEEAAAAAAAEAAEAETENADGEGTADAGNP